VSAGAVLRCRVLLDGTTAAADQARALAAALKDVSQDAAVTVAAETVVFCVDEDGGRKVAALAPTVDVQLVQAPARRPDVMVERLLALDEADVGLYLAGPGSTGVELATRLACRTGGAALSRVLELRLAGRSARCRARVYSGHLTGRFELQRRPWCLSIDAAWADERCEPPAAHRVLWHPEGSTGPGGAEDSAPPLGPGAAAGAGRPAAEPFADLELVAPAAGDLAGARLLVIAGYGAGREGVRRLAAAADRMGAAFGVSRPVVMNAWAPLDRLVGASGARTAPQLCIVAAASGAPALYWGIERAAFVVAVNTDEHAPIVQGADAVVVGDAVAVVEALAALVESRG
jgi:electron transfer flavoprotein alpha subunit